MENEIFDSEEENDENDTSALSLCYDGIEIQRKWITEEQYLYLLPLFEHLFSFDNKEAIRAKELIENEFPYLKNSD